MKQLTQRKNKLSDSPKHALLNDVLIALVWALLVGVPLFVVHMVLFDFEHSQHMDESYSFIQSITSSVPHHPISLSLWLSAIFIATFAIRRSFQQKIFLTHVQAELTLSQTQALSDGLTGTWNRAGFDQLFEMNLKRGQEQNRFFSVILGDVDGLKEYNDTYGHPAADEALKAVTKILSEQCRAIDELARYGGDEFALFCIDIDQRGAEILITRLREALKNAPVSMSFGTATFPTDGVDRHTLLGKADVTLYAAKSKVPSHNEAIENCECEVCNQKKHFKRSGA
ncbi:MAG: hypothetical protein CVU42_12145 [Chloroflexi bacterium HGW-Chloroflexi-4]|jgi:diguanylate cyclase (GGDEF)-like protein|nr:MAG: hypothetical protein CVU42_12145 [Chloroflexi bacterium HGW-Chloroflexi-4]